MFLIQRNSYVHVKIKHTYSDLYLFKYIKEKSDHTKFYYNLNN